MENQVITRKNTFYCRTRRMANFLLENGAVMKTIVVSRSEDKGGLAFIFERNETLEALVERWKTEKDAYRNPM